MNYETSDNSTLATICHNPARQVKRLCNSLVLHDLGPWVITYAVPEIGRYYLIFPPNFRSLQNIYASD